MPRLRKLAIPETVVFVTTTAEAGVVFPCNPLIKLIIEHCIARALTLHPGIIISHLVVEATHVHLVATVKVPIDLKGFMERFKTESAHAINKLLGRKKRTLWCEGYDSPMLLTLADVIEKIVYLYTNPAKDNLEDSIVNYPGYSTWRMWRSGSYRTEVPHLRRYLFAPLRKTLPFAKEGELRVTQLRRRVRERHAFTIEPNAWMTCFGITDAKERKTINETILDRIQETESLFRKEREAKGWRVIGRARLVAAPIDTNYIPNNRSGRCMLCHSKDKQALKDFLSRVKPLFRQAREVYESWKKGIYVPFPAGLYPPSFPRQAELDRQVFFGC